MAVLNYNKFLNEYNRKTLNLLTINEISNSFTIAFEIEMECDDENISATVHEEDLIKELKSKLISLLKNEKIDYAEKLFFIEELCYACQFDYEDKTLDSVLNYDKYKDDMEAIIVYHASIIYSDIMERMDDDPNMPKDETKLEYFTEKIKEHLPKLYEKYNDTLNYVLDATLDKGIEINQLTYIDGINNSILFLNDFFDEFEKQSYWKFTNKTGIHINIGIKNEDIDWNIVKGMIILKDIGTDIPFVYKNIAYRMNTSFTNSIFDQLELDKTKIDLNDINGTEDYINKEIEKVFKKQGPKKFAFNINHIKKQNYVEFRYIGGQVNKEIVIEKLLYFCYVVYAMTNSNYERRKYLKNLYKYFDSLN